MDQHDNVTVKYSYGVKTKKKRTPEFMWDYLTWTRCSAECGIGIQMALPRCIEKKAGLVSEKFCINITKPHSQIRPCEIAPCIARQNVYSYVLYFLYKMHYFSPQLDGR